MGVGGGGREGRGGGGGGGGRGGIPCGDGGGSGPTCAGSLRHVSLNPSHSVLYCKCADVTKLCFLTTQDTYLPLRLSVARCVDLIDCCCADGGLSELPTGYSPAAIVSLSASRYWPDMT